MRDPLRRLGCFPALVAALLCLCVSAPTPARAEGAYGPLRRIAARWQGRERLRLFPRVAAGSFAGGACASGACSAR